MTQRTLFSTRSASICALTLSFAFSSLVYGQGTSNQPAIDQNGRSGTDPQDPADGVVIHEQIGSVDARGCAELFAQEESHAGADTPRGGTVRQDTLANQNAGGIDGGADEITASEGVAGNSQGSSTGLNDAYLTLEECRQQNVIPHNQPNGSTNETGSTANGPES